MKTTKGANYVKQDRNLWTGQAYPRRLTGAGGKGPKRFGC